MSTTPTPPVTPIGTSTPVKPACKHLHTKRPHNDHTLICEDCKKDITETQDGPVAKAAPIAPASTPVVTKDAA